MFAVFTVTWRFALSYAAKVCGDPGVNFTDTSCSVYSQALNETRDFGIWLSGAPEWVFCSLFLTFHLRLPLWFSNKQTRCTWYGVTCSADGIVRAVELINNNLAGVLPHELTGEGHNFTQMLSLNYFVTLSYLSSLLHSSEISSNSCVSGKLPLWHNSFGIWSVGSFVESWITWEWSGKEAGLSLCL